MLTFLKKLFKHESSPKDEESKSFNTNISKNTQEHKEPFLETLTEIIPDHQADPGQVPSLGTIDRIDWHEETVWERLTEEEAENMDDETHREIQAYAGNHIGIFMAWLANRNLMGSEDIDYSREGINQLQTRQITGTDYLIDYCDTKFWSVDVATSLHPFIEAFYNDYMSLYAGYLPPTEDPYSRLFSWSDYDQLAPQIDALYQKYTSS